MNERKFEAFQHAADKAMLEEAQTPMKKKNTWARDRKSTRRNSSH